MKQYPQTAGFVGLAVRQVVWIQLFFLTSGRVGISQVVQKKLKKKQKTNKLKPNNKQRVEGRNRQTRI